MHSAEIDAIVESLPRGRTLFYYFRDRYALLLLESLASEDRSITTLKASQFAPLLTKPIVKERLARCGDGRLDRAELHATWPEHVAAYRLTVGRWPSKKEKWQRNWHQMVRPGQNLVLQLNFSRRDQRRLMRLRGESDIHPGDAHPVANPPELTLAWARLDINRERGEALIEELQSDWVKDQSVFDKPTSDCDRQIERDQRVLRRHFQLWPEAMLAATIHFVTTELGVRRVFLHDYETGNRLKGFSCDCCRPPRSLYSRLPRKFCFRQTAAGPMFLRGERSRWLRRQMIREDTRWWVLELPPPAEPRSSPAVFHHDVPVPVHHVTIAGSWLAAPSDALFTR